MAEAAGLRVRGAAEGSERLMKPTCASLRKEGLKGAARCGNESCAFLRIQRPLSRLEQAVDARWQGGEVKLNVPV